MEGSRQARKRYTRSALDIIVVAQYLVAIPFEHANRIGPFPILEMDAAAREHLLNCLDKLIRQFVQFLIGQRLLAQPEIERIGAQRIVGRADVEQHWQKA